MKLDIIVSSIRPGGGITTFVHSTIKGLSMFGNSMRLIVTHERVDDNSRNVLQSYASRGIVDLSGYCKLYRYIKLFELWNESPCDIIVNNYNAVGQYVLALLNRKIACLHVVHNLTSDFARVAMISRKRVNRWVCPSEGVLAMMSAFLKKEELSRCVVIPHGVEEADAPAAKNCSNVVRLLFVGALEDHKGVDVLPRIVEKLDIMNVSYRLTIVGTGSQDRTLTYMMGKGLECGKVIMTGYLPHDEVLDLMHESDLFIYPTKIDSFGLVIAEAMMSGCIPIVGRIEGVTDMIVSHGKDGFVTDNDCSEIALHIKNLAEAPDKLRQMSKEAYAKAHSCFNSKKMIQSYQSLLQQIDYDIRSR